MYLFHFYSILFYLVIRHETLLYYLVWYDLLFGWILVQLLSAIWRVSRRSMLSIVSYYLYIYIFYSHLYCARMLEGFRIWVSWRKVMRFVSESLPRLISGADGNDPLPQTLVFITTREAGLSPILAVFRALLA